VPPPCQTGQLTPRRPAPYANDSTNADVEAVRFAIEGATTDSKASAVAVHIGGSRALLVLVL
jgi:hypothetical protein